MIHKLLFLIATAGSILLYKAPVIAFSEKSDATSINVQQSLTKEEQKKLPFLIALSFKETFHKNAYFASFIEGLKMAEQEKTISYQELPEIQAYATYMMQIALDPKITKNLDESLQYLQEQQKEGAVPLVDDKIYYKIIKKGSKEGIKNGKINKAKINFSIKDADENSFAKNYSLSGPISCVLSKLIPGMAHGMLGMRLNELREIYIDPEFVYGVFSNFGNGKAVSIQVELVDCESSDQVFYPSLIPVDLAKLLNSPSHKIDMISLQKDYMTYCGRTSWLFYKHKMPELNLADILPLLESDDPSMSLSTEDRDILHKFHWLIYSKES